MADDEWLRRKEAELRHARHAEEAAQRQRSDFLSGLNPRERADFLVAEEAAERQAKRARDSERREQGRVATSRYKLQQAQEKEKLRQRHQKLILQLWQEFQCHQLSEARQAEFVARPEYGDLASCEEEDILLGARRAMDADDGRLLLSRWLEEAVSRARRLEELRLRSPTEDRSG